VLTAVRVLLVVEDIVEDEYCVVSLVLVLDAVVLATTELAFAEALVFTVVAVPLVSIFFSPFCVVSVCLFLRSSGESGPLHSSINQMAWLVVQAPASKQASISSKWRISVCFWRQLEIKSLLPQEDLSMRDTKSWYVHSALEEETIEAIVKE